MNCGRPIAIAQNATDGNDDDVPKKVFAIACMTRIGEGLKERTNGFDIDELRHENILEIEANRHAITFAFNDGSRSKDMAHRPGAQGPYLAQLCALALLVYAVKGGMKERKQRKKRVAKAAMAAHSVGTPAVKADALTMIRETKALAAKAGGYSKLMELVAALAE